MIRALLPTRNNDSNNRSFGFDYCTAMMPMGLFNSLLGTWVIMTNSTDARGQWGTKSGSILAALGAAIGLGNIWRFSYIVGDNGGGAFLLIYFAAIALVGLPLVLVELSIGRWRSARQPRHSGILAGPVSGVALGFSVSWPRSLS